MNHEDTDNKEPFQNIPEMLLPIFGILGLVILLCFVLWYLLPRFKKTRTNNSTFVNAKTFGLQSNPATGNNNFTLGIL